MCGYLGHYSGRCRCTPDQVLRYRAKLCGPLLDRIDIQIEVSALREKDLLHSAVGESSAAVRTRVERAYQLQLERQGKPNADLLPLEIDRLCLTDAAAATLARRAITRLSLSARAYYRVLKLARTIADLAREEIIAVQHIAEAVQYRRFDGGRSA